MLPKKVDFILAIFDFVGFNTRSSSCICKIIFCNIFHLVLFGFCAYCCVQYIEFILSPVERLNLAVQFCGALFTYALIWIESTTNQNPQRDFWKIHNKIHECYDDRKHFSWQSFIIKFTEHNLITALFMAFLVYTSSSFHIITLISGLEILIKINQFRIFHYMLYLDMIRMNLNIAQVEAIKASILIDSVKESVERIRELYQMIFEMVNKLNVIFGFSHLAAVLYCFYCPIVELNWAFVYFRYLSLPSKIGKLILS